MLLPCVIRQASKELEILSFGALKPKATLHTILYYTTLYYTILYCTIMYYTIRHHTTLYYTTPYDTILYDTILYYTTLDYYCTIAIASLYHTIPYHTKPYHDILCYTILGCSVLNQVFQSLQTSPQESLSTTWEVFPSKRACKRVCQQHGKSFRHAFLIQSLRKLASVIRPSSSTQVLCTSLSVPQLTSKEEAIKQTEKEEGEAD